MSLSAQLIEKNFYMLIISMNILVSVESQLFIYLFIKHTHILKSNLIHLLY